MFKNTYYSLSVALVSILLSTSAAHAATLSVTPPSGSPTVGSTFDVQIVLNATGQS